MSLPLGEVGHMSRRYAATETDTIFMQFRQRKFLHAFSAELALSMSEIVYSGLCENREFVDR